MICGKILKNAHLNLEVFRKCEVFDNESIFTIILGDNVKKHPRISIKYSRGFDSSLASFVELREISLRAEAARQNDRLAVKISPKDLIGLITAESYLII